MNMEGAAKPVEEGQTIEVTIDSKGGRGDGIAHVEGFVIFVSGAEVGQKCNVKITKVARTFATADKV